jgi:acyl-CoA thioesterase FadM
VRFLAPACFDDAVELGVLVTHLGTTSMSTRHTVQRDGALLAETDLRHVWVDARSHAKAAIPEWVRTGLAPWTAVGG